jgi:plastocyanin
MNTNKIFLTCLVAAFVFTMAAFAGNSLAIAAEEKCSIITIQDQEPVSPATFKVNTGDCVVWVNWSNGKIIRIVFKEGKKCADAVKSASGFKIDRKGCFITGFFAYGNTASLVFSNRVCTNMKFIFPRLTVLLKPPES